ncbi:MAG: glycosyltransferase [Schleiferiaceae bacterium]|jgi:glycosyltransferase involved in cell wall biosynthesis|nr:glycosyltransferase [Schleiferiaceae bacterium]
MHKIEISVIMPVYKGDVAPHFDDALASVVDQSYPAKEIVVIKDGPLTDELYQVLDKWCKKSELIKPVTLEKNVGLSSALNAGIDAANYEWLARMDADDICKPDRFEKQVRFIEANPEVSILGSWITEFDEDMNEEIAVRKLPETHDEILNYAKWRCPFNHMTVMYKRDAIVALGKYKNYGAVGDDYELWARFLVNGYKSGNLQEVLVDARTGKDFFGNRRRGMKYFKNEVREINDLYKLGLINPLHYAFHFSIKAVVRFSPPALVKLIYKGIRKTS